MVLSGADIDPDFGIDSVIAIPIDEWSLDLVTPNTECVRKNGGCIKSEFPNPPEDSTMIPFNGGETDAASKPAGILDEDTTLLYVDELNPITDINGRVPKPGLYVLVAQYYQPDKPSKICIATKSHRLATFQKKSLNPFSFSAFDLPMNISYSATEGEGKY